MSDPINPYEEKRKPSPGEEEVVVGGYLLDLFRRFKIDVPSEEDKRAVERVGGLLKRWWRTKILRRK